MPGERKEAVRAITCIKCEKRLKNILADSHQPVDGLAFFTQGHYGSGYFDPMDGTYLELSICDECVEAADKKGYVFHSARPLGDGE